MMLAKKQRIVNNASYYLNYSKSILCIYTHEQNIIMLVKKQLTINDARLAGNVLASPGKVTMVNAEGAEFHVSTIKNLRINNKNTPHTCWNIYQMEKNDLK